jgi:enoyl-CoA hydratase
VSELLVAKQGAVTELTLNRPEKRNALSSPLVEALIGAISAAERDGTRLLVLQGAGKGFSAGFDFSSLDTDDDAALALRFLRIETLLQAVRYAPFSTLALVHGACYGAAADLVVSCRHRVASPDGTFRMPGLRFGVVLGTRRLAALVGMDVARDLLEASKVFSASEALKAGFLTDVQERSAFPAAIAAAADAGDALSPDANRALLHLTAPDTRDADMASLARSVSEPGLKERIRAFRAGA